MKTECTEVKADSGSKKQSLVENKIKLFTKCTYAIKNTTLIESAFKTVQAAL